MAIPYKIYQEPIGRRVSESNFCQCTLGASPLNDQPSSLLNQLYHVATDSEIASSTLRLAELHGLGFLGSTIDWDIFASKIIYLLNFHIV